MKLRTEISDCGDGDVMLVYNGDSDVAGDEQLEHDTAAAHALMQAINDSVDSNSSRARADALIAKADELMRQWGFESNDGGSESLGAKG